MKRIYQNKRELIEREVSAQDTVLDVGFMGQGVTKDDSHWPHRMLKGKAAEVYGLDLDIPQGSDFAGERYFKGSAENFSLPASFDLVFAGDLIEHLSNPGLFLDACAKHLRPGGRLIITTPNCFSLFNMAEKLTKYEPTVNRDHTCYFNEKTLRQLLGKNGWKVESSGHIYSLDVEYRESLRKKLLNIIYRLVSWFTPKFLETIVIIAKRA